MDQLSEEAKKALRFDPLAAAEVMTGQSYEESKKTVALGLQLQQANHERKRMLLSEMGDTHFRIPWSDFVEVVTAYGFELVVRRRFEYRFDKEEVDFPEQLIAAHRDKKLLLHATSFLSDKGEIVNGGSVYGEIEAADHEALWSALSGCSHGYEGSDRRSFSRDVREGLILALTDIEAVGAFVDWSDRDPFLWLLDYTQEKNPDRDWRVTRDGFLANAPDWVRGFIL